MFVLGGTGALGRCAVPSLVAAGHDVSALTRTDEKAAWVSAQGAKPVLYLRAFPVGDNVLAYLEMAPATGT